MYCQSCGKEMENAKGLCSACTMKSNQHAEAIARERLDRPQLQTSPNASDSSQSVMFAVLGWLFFILSLLFLPVLFGMATFVMGLIVYQQRNQLHGVVLMALSVIVIIIGFLL
ncbi:hypothetical protein NC661_20995 [Aquibacillus koreensis]|uniref:Uncharacterized protein n=1 Tax=Aquibacillus koreensis TaxID=279446 RepID=A0A9X3WQF2_9BACI|nr:hypothetical protein [Aquibacillus koreensis]MCT2536984.1 hypothetical protein [Aquibacillus koreensis]MDC3422823.1 hypothetical protein [Aquibacillus koreensis]